jgi:hypothetical protein
MITRDDDSIDDRGELTGSLDPTRSSHMSIAYARRAVAYELTQDTHGLQALLWKLPIL